MLQATSCWLPLLSEMLSKAQREGGGWRQGPLGLPADPMLPSHSCLQIPGHYQYRIQTRLLVLNTTCFQKPKQCSGLRKIRGKAVTSCCNKPTANISTIKLITRSLHHTAPNIWVRRTPAYAAGKRFYWGGGGER